MNLALLKKEAQETAKRLEDRLNKAIEEERELTEDEAAEQAEDDAKLDRLAAQILAAERLSSRVNAINFGDPEEDDEAEAEAARGQPRLRRSLPAEARSERSGFRHLAEFAMAVRNANLPNAGIDDRLAAPTNVVTESSGDPAGAYLVPAEFRRDIVSLVYEGEEPLINLIEQRPTASNRVQLLGNEWTPWGGTGIQANWRSEGSQMSPTKPGLTPREVKLNELYVFCNVTEEALEDAPLIASMLTTDAAAAIRYKLANGYTYGDGVEKPLGFLNASNGSLVTVAKEGSQAADTILPANVAKMYSRLIMPNQGVWIANSDILPQVMAFESPNGQMLWQSDYRQSPGGLLLGRPLYFSEHAKTVGDVGDLTFLNPNGYMAYRKQNGISFADSIHLYFDYNLRSFRWIIRAGGMPLLSAAVSPDNGSNSKSHFVALAERA